MVEDGEFLHLTCKPKLTIKAPDGNNFIDLETVLDGSNLFLKISEAMKCQKDVNLKAPNGTYINIQGMDGMQPGDDPILYLSNASLLTDNDIDVYGSIGSLTDPTKTTGGGVVIIGHGWTATSDYPAIVVTDYPSGSGYNTLWLKYSSGMPSNLSSLAWGNLKLGNLTAAGTINVGSNASISEESDQLKLSFKYGNVKFYNSYYNVLETSGALYLKCQMYPYSTNYYQLGLPSRYWQNVWTGTLYYKDAQMFGCDKELSDQVVESRFKSTDEAEAFLRHETTKAWRHIKYADSGKIVCTCGKEVDHPCPEHEAEWQEKYCLNTGDIIKASGQLVVKLLDEVKELRTAVNKLQTKSGGLSEQKTPQLPPEIQQQITILNMRITNANLANADLLREMDATFKQLLSKISELEQENAELKAEPKETQKTR